MNGLVVFFRLVLFSFEVVEFTIIILPFELAFELAVDFFLADLYMIFAVVAAVHSGILSFEVELRGEISHLLSPRYLQVF